MGRRGSELAVEISDAAIIRDEFSAIPNVIELSGKAHRDVVDNFITTRTLIAVLVTRDFISTIARALPR